jgi:polyhydroxyalkanoate synthesis regulator phasin
MSQLEVDKVIPQSRTTSQQTKIDALEARLTALENN